MKAPITPQVIGELRRRVIHHNEHLDPALHATGLTRLQTLKGLYKRWYGGKEPHTHALVMIDQHLAKIRGETLHKAEEERDDKGRWTGQKGFYSDVAKPAEHRALAAENAGYDAAQTQVIPETRYSLYGPPIAGAAGVGIGALTGATASFKGSPVDRAITRGLGWTGEKAGSYVGGAAGLPIRGAARLSRAGIGAVNRTFHTTHPRPGPAGGEALARRVKIAVQDAGRATGHGLGHAQAFAYSVAPATARRGGEWLFPKGSIPSRISGRAAGGIVGGLVTGGLVTGPTLYNMATTLGPYLDAAFPRRVRKMAGDLFDDEAVLAKQAELLTLDLAKIDYTPLLRGAAASGRAARRIVATLFPSVASHAAGPVGAPATTIGSLAGAEAYRAAGNFQVGRLAAARARDVATHAAALGSLGAGVGAIGGAAGVAAHDYFRAEAHPRDPKGRFATKAKAARSGAKIGGAIGLGAGLLVGLAAARRGHTAVLRDALGRLGTSLTAMRTQAEAGAREAHAKAFIDAHPKSVPKFAPGGPATHEQVRQSLEAHAGTEFARGPGAAIRGGPVAWYTHQIDQAFDREALAKLRQIPDATGARTPLVDKAGNAVRGNLVHQLDADKLNPGQRKLWDDMRTRREAAVKDVADVFDKRRGQLREIDTHVTGLKAEQVQIGRDLDYVPERAQELEANDESVTAIKRFAKEKLGHELQAKTKPTALNELKGVIQDWEIKSNQRLIGIENDINDSQAMLAAGRSTVSQDLTDGERMAVRNPFAEGRRAFFDPLPNYDVTKKQVEVAASRAFLRESDQHAKEAIDHLQTLVDAQIASHAARLPQTGMLGRQFQRAAPVLAARLHQASLDYAALTTARRASLTGTRKEIYDWLHANRDPQQALRTARTLSTRASAQGKRALAFSLRNWKTIASLAGVAGTLGAVDINAPSGKRLRLNPKDWHRPKGLDVVFDRPSENEALIGLSYRDRENQQRFLHGVHINSAAGNYSNLPYGMTVGDAKARLRNRGGDPQNPQRTRAEAIEVKDPAAVKQAADQLRSNNGIGSAGPPEAQFRARTAASSKADQDVSEAFYQHHLLGAERFKGSTTNQKNRYWGSLKSLFEGQNSELLSIEDRSRLLTGAGNKRGIFANKGGVFGHPRQADKTKVTSELVRQISDHTPTNSDEYRQLKRALWTVSQHFDLSGEQKRQVITELDKHYEKSNAQAAPSAPASVAAGSRARSEDVEHEAVRQVAPHARQPDYQTDEELRTAVRSVYQSAVASARRLHGPDDAQPWTEEELHAHARRRALDFVNDTVTKGEPAGDLRKYLSWPGASNGADAPRVPGVPGVSGTPRAPKLPSIGGSAGSLSGGTKPRQAAPPRGASHNLGQATDAAHQLSQVGSYGGGNALFDAAEGVAALAPGGGFLTHTVAPGIAGIVGGIGGAAAGRAAGQQLGATGPSPNEARSTGESTTRSLAGLGGNLAGMEAGKTIARVGLKAAPGELASQAAGLPRAAASKISGAASKLGNLVSRGAGKAAAGEAGEGLGQAAARSATTGTFERLGGEIGGDVGGVGGAVAGEAVDPAGGGIAGKWGGRALGAAVGAGAGWLADEGVGLLYRHLGGYGAHVPAMAAKTLGIAPKKTITQPRAGV
jgi:hypothetical protein